MKIKVDEKEIKIPKKGAKIKSFQKILENSQKNASSVKNAPQSLFY